MRWLDWLFDTASFQPRATCGAGWSSGLVTAHVLADELIFTSYLYLPAILCAWWRYRWPLSRTTILLWALFILTCGATHQSDVLMFTHPWYRLHAGVKLLCATCSLAACLQTSVLGFFAVRAGRRWRS